MSKIRSVLLAGIVIGLSGCAPESQMDEIADRVDVPAAVEDSDVADTAAVDSAQVEDLPPFAERIVLFIEASAEELDAARSNRDAEDYYTMADDLMWYRASAYEFLEKNGLPVRTLQGRQPLRFVVNGKVRPFDYSHIPMLDVVILFDTNRDPVAVAPIDIEEAVRSYFH